MARIRLTPARLDLQLYAGDGVLLGMRMWWPDGQTFELDGELSAQIRARRDSPNVLAEWDVQTDPVEHTAQWSLTGQQTRELMNGQIRFQGFWDMQLIPDATGEPVTLVAGRVRCDLDVTRNGHP